MTFQAGSRYLNIVLEKWEIFFHFFLSPELPLIVHSIGVPIGIR